MSNFMMNSIGVMLTYSTYFGIVAAMVMVSIIKESWPLIGCQRSGGKYKKPKNEHFLWQIQG